MNLNCVFCEAGNDLLHTYINCITYSIQSVKNVYKVHTPTNELLIKLDKILKFTLKITLICSYMFRFLSMAIIREPSPEPN